MLQGFEGTLTREPVELPENQNIEAALSRVGQHGLKPSSVGFAARIVIFVLTNDDPALSLAIL